MDPKATKRGHEMIEGVSQENIALLHKIRFTFSDISLIFTCEILYTFNISAFNISVSSALVITATKVTPKLH